MTTASENSFCSDDQATSQVLLLGAAGNSGQLIAAELAARGLSIRLAGRRRGPLDDLARALAADGATTDVRTVDISDAASLAEAIAGVGVVLSTIGPFARQAGPVIDTCLAAGAPYMDIANEWVAVRRLLDRDEQARAHGVALVTSAATVRPSRASQRVDRAGRERSATAARVHGCAGRHIQPVNAAGVGARTTGCTRQHIELAGLRLLCRRVRARGGRRARNRRRTRVEHGDPVASPAFAHRRNR